MKHRVLLLITLTITLTACTEQVPPGTVGMKMAPNGLTGEVLEPGRHSCWGRDKMILISTRERVHTERLSILCKDDLNFKFDLKIRTRLRVTDAKGIKALLRQQGSAVKWDKNVGTLSDNILYNTYVSPAARSIARDVVAKYETTQIRENRAAIQKAIQAALAEAVKSSPVELTLVATSNFDYPDVITKAVEKRREREIAIGEERAKQSMVLLMAKNKQTVALLEMENRKRLAQIRKQVRLAEAEAENAYELLRAQGIKQPYLELKKLENQALLYSRANNVQVFQVGNGGSARNIPAILPVIK